MAKTAHIAAFAVLVSLALLFGCVSNPQQQNNVQYPSPSPATGNSQMPGSDRDSHGCIGSAGYVWCNETQQCIRPWETNCTPPQLVGNDRDEHGCIGSAGYTWCEEKQECIRSWEETCNSSDREAKALTHCADANAAQVSVCGNHIRVVSDLMGGGTAFYSDNGTKTVCPLVSPDSMSGECSLLVMGSNCVEKIITCPKTPKAVSDLKDDPSFVGAQLTWSKPDGIAIEYAIYRGNANLSSVSLLKVTSQLRFDDVFNGGNQTYAYFVRARDQTGKESANSNVVLVQQLSNANTPSPGQID